MFVPCSLARLMLLYINIFKYSCLYLLFIVYCTLSVCNTDASDIYIYTTSYLNLTYFYLDVSISSEEACSVLLPVLATVVMWRGKKSVVCVAQCVAALIPVHWTPSFLSDMYHLDPPGAPVRFPVRDCWCRPVDHIKVRAYAYDMLSYVKIRTYDSKNKIRVWYAYIISCCFHFASWTLVQLLLGHVPYNASRNSVL